ncbi:MAG: AAA family ATPase [Chloroflexota bacterium]|nr:AAA family ATPase [Chloroflexota bacterium]
MSEADWFGDGNEPAQGPIAVRARPAVLSWAELMAQPADPPPQLCPGVPKVGVTVIAGAPKVGKTLLLSQRALEVRQPVLLVIEEGSLAGISYRLRRQAAELGISNPPIHVMHRQRVRLDDHASVRRLRGHVEDVGAVFVGLDPLNKLHGADENRPAQMTPVMESLAGIAYDYSCAVVAAHHLAKPSAERRGDVWDRFRGAGAIRSGTDANLALDGSGERVRLVGEFRDAEPLAMWLELDRDALLFTEAEPPDAPAKVDPMALRAYVEERGQVTARQVMEQFGVVKGTALSALRALGCDEYSGARGQLVFTLGVTVQ